MRSPKRCPRWLKSTMAVALLFSLFVVNRVTAQLPCSRADIGTHHLHYCMDGEGEVTVVFEAGMQSDSRTWRLVAPAVATFTRVLTYDRAGMGNSDRGPVPRTSIRIARELERLLHVAGVEGPVLLVGHSAGGWHLRAFAAEFPDRVRGLVLLDSPHEDFDARRTALLSAHERTERLAMLEDMRARLPEGSRLEYEGLDANPPELWQRPLPEVPVVVLSAELHDWRPAATAEAQERAWRELQAELARLSPHGRVEVVAGSGHNIQLDQPATVVEVIEQVLKRVGVEPARKNGA
jgi:pimeloyl-ACP methyl ester carboxylesterase